MKKAIIFFLLLFNFPILFAQCLLPASDGLEQFLEEEFSNHAINNQKMKRWENYAYKAEADSLYRFAIAFFRENLPQDILCKRLALNDKTDFNFSSGTITFGFRFFYDENAVSYRDEGIHINFSMNVKTKEISRRERRDKIPNCVASPDSCHYKVKNKGFAKAIALAENFITTDDIVGYNFGKRRENHYVLTKYLAEDCMSQSIYINRYTGKTYLSDAFKRKNCAFLIDKVRYAEIIVEGVIRKRTGTNISGATYSIAEIEVNQIFKGEVTQGIIGAITVGGNFRGHSSSLSHGSIGLGKEGERYIFFLEQDNLSPKGEEYGFYEEFYRAGKLTAFPLFIAKSDALPISASSNFFHAFQIEKDLYQALERETGQERKRIIYPANRNEKIIDWLMDKHITVPDRQNGLVLNTQVNNYEESSDSFKIITEIKSTTRVNYFKNWQMLIKYNPKAFGDLSSKLDDIRLNVFRRVKLGGELTKRITGLPVSYQYDLKSGEEGELIISFTKEKEESDYFQIVPETSFISYPRLLFDLSLPVINERENANISVDFVEKPQALNLKTGDNI